MNFEHNSVLLEETIESLNIKPNGIYVDGTLGGGGHALEICKRLNKEGRLIGIDQDINAIKAAQERLKEYSNVTIVRNNYSQIREVLKNLNIDAVDGILLDIGVSSHQLDNPERGFSYMSDAPLDMRMDQSSNFSARDLINDYSEEELLRVIRDYGEERYAKNIVRNIIKARTEKPIETTGELIELIKKSVPIKAQIQKGHPAKKTFQAIRIEVNKELDVLDTTIDSMINLLTSKGRLSIITFHSLEDRIVKNRFRNNENPCICPSDFPICACGNQPTGRVITRKPIIPSESEIVENKRSKSSKLRVFERN